MPLSLEHAKNSFVAENAMEYMVARSAPRRNSRRSVALAVSYTRTNVPFSDAVARRAPSSESASMARSPSCALMNLVAPTSYSSTRTWPLFRPGHAITVCPCVGDSAHSPFGLAAVSVWCTIFKSEKLYT